MEGVVSSDLRPSRDCRIHRKHATGPALILSPAQPPDHSQAEPRPSPTQHHPVLPNPNHVWSHWPSPNTQVTHKGLWWSLRPWPTAASWNPSNCHRTHPTPICCPAQIPDCCLGTERQSIGIIDRRTHNLRGRAQVSRRPRKQRKQRLMQSEYIQVLAPSSLSTWTRTPPISRTRRQKLPTACKMKLKTL